MRDINEVLKDKRIKSISRNVQNDLVIQVKLIVHANYNNKDALIKFTRANGWEHLCVGFEDETPNWDFMEEMKEMFWEDEEEAIQYHPRKSEYINNNEHCLHVWRSLEYSIPRPPTVLIGFREGHEEEDKIEFMKMQRELGNPISEAEADFMVKLSMNKDKMLNKEEFTEMIKDVPLEVLIKTLMRG